MAAIGGKFDLVSGSPTPSHWFALFQTLPPAITIKQISIREMVTCQWSDGLKLLQVKGGISRGVYSSTVFPFFVLTTP